MLRNSLETGNLCYNDVIFSRCIVKVFVFLTSSPSCVSFVMHGLYEIRSETLQKKRTSAYVFLFLSANVLPIAAGTC
jgi:hypothetical protein